jgi:hypothetical protein
MIFFENKKFQEFFAYIFLRIPRFRIFATLRSSPGMRGRIRRLVLPTPARITLSSSTPTQGRRDFPDAPAPQGGDLDIAPRRIHGVFLRIHGVACCISGFPVDMAYCIS